VIPAVGIRKQRFVSEGVLMKKLAFLVTFCGLVVASFVFASQAQAQATRTWVSGVGDDANPCSRTAPCKTFAGAISKTAVNGEINALDPGGFGAVTITKSITINGEGTMASITAPGFNGVVINGAGIIVTLRNLDIEGAGTGLSGVRFLQGAALHVENSTIRNFRGGAATGIEFAPSSAGAPAELFVHNVVVSGSGTGGAAAASVVLDQVRVENNTRGIVVNGLGGTGAVGIVISDSLAAGSTGAGILAETNASVIRMTIDGVTSARNAQGISVSGAGAAVLVGSSTIAGNLTGALVASGGTLQSFKNNQFGQNSVAGTPITAVPGGPLN
jgi:hypothetical protein